MVSPARGRRGVSPVPEPTVPCPNAGAQAHDVPHILSSCLFEHATLSVAKVWHRFPAPPIVLSTRARTGSHVARVASPVRERKACAQGNDTGPRGARNRVQVGPSHSHALVHVVCRLRLTLCCSQRSLSLSIEGWLLPSSVRCLFNALQALAQQQQQRGRAESVASAAQAAGTASGEPAASGSAPDKAALVFTARLTTHPQTLYFDAAMQRAARERATRDRRTVGFGHSASRGNTDFDREGSIVAMETVVGWLAGGGGSCGSADADDDDTVPRKRCERAGCMHTVGGGCQLDGEPRFFRVIESRAARP